MNRFEEVAKHERKTGAISEFWLFLNQTRKWWLLPIVIVLLAFGLLLALSGTAAAPFIYTLF